MLYISCFAGDGNNMTIRVILISDAGLAISEKSDFLDVVRKSNPLDSNTVVLFLGIASNDTAVLRRAASLIDHTEAKAVFVPGFYDWEKGKGGGYKNVQAQQHFLEALGNKNIKCYPGGGCPGPVDIELPNDVVLLIMDSQWWLQEHDKPGMESGCPFRTREQVCVEVEDMLEHYVDKLVLFTAYHPFKSTGIHSGRFGLKQHLFPLTDASRLEHFYLPLPVVGSIYPLSRNVITTNQDMNNNDYQDMVKLIDKYVKPHPHAVYLSGKEHNMELLSGGGHYYAGNNSALSPTRTRHAYDVDFAEQETGYTVFEASADKKMKIRFYEVHDGASIPVYTSAAVDYSLLSRPADTARVPYIAADSTVASANTTYARASRFKRFITGNNYRDVWAMKVKMKVLHLGSEKGGLHITGLGGGHQSKSLQLEDANGKKWVLRTVNKSLEEVIPDNFKESVASDMAQDMISASNPYGALVAPDLLSALHIVHATPEIVFVPNDTVFGEYKTYFANTVCLLEERDPKMNDGKTFNTFETVNKIIDKGDRSVDCKSFLKARLVDFLLADFDRHYGQWKWGTIDTGEGKTYYPIPKDRDQALFNSDGILLKIAKGQGLGYMQGFNEKIRDIDEMGFVARDIDKFFLSQLDEQEWHAMIGEFKNNLTDSVISTAVSKLPAEVYARYGKAYRDKLIERREVVARKGMEYYRFLSHRVNITGSNQDDIFRVTGEHGGIRVTVCTKDKEDTVLRYSRWFDPSVTREINLYGFGGEDHFEMEAGTRSAIKFNIVGGKGNDTFNIKGGSRNSIYDMAAEDNAVLSRSRTRNMISDDYLVNEYRFRENVYNSQKFPAVTLGYNEDDGVLAGLAFSRTTHAFRKDSFATDQRLAAMLALTRQGWQVSYRGDFINVYRYWDVQARASVTDPALEYFYGYGNETKKDASKPTGYYRTRYDYVSADLLLRRRLHNRHVASIALGPSVYYYWNDHNRNRSRILEFPSVAGLDSQSVYTSKLFAGAKLIFRIDNLKNELLPKQGIRWNTELTILNEMNDNTQPLVKLQSDMSLYATLSHPSRLMAELHLGGGHIFSDHFEYYQALTLGANNYLRGFRHNRFTGSSMVYGSVELKLKVFDVNTYVVKGDLGIIGFNDVGRAWMRNEHSDIWHDSYGGGIYFTPYNYVIVSVLAAMSKEDTLFSAGLGTSVNIAF